MVKNVVATLVKQDILKKGQILSGRYEIIERIGEGGYCVVYRAFDKILARYIALKILKLNSNSEQENIDRYYREGRTLAQLEHENIISFYSFEVLDNGSPMAAMEYLDGQSLATLLAERGPLDAKVAGDILLQAADGLAHAHGAGVVHRDLSPSNIFLLGKYPNFKVKIIDFGLSNSLVGGSDKLTKTNQIFGSPSYMAPEQWRAASLSPAADIYAFACIMYEMLSGKQAFSGHSLFAIMNMQQNEFPAEPCIIGADSPTSKLYKAIILRGLQKDANNRFSSCFQLISALKGELTPEDIWEMPKRIESNWTFANTRYSLSIKRAASYLAMLLTLVLIFASFSFFANRNDNSRVDAAVLVPDCKTARSRYYEKILQRRTDRYGNKSKHLIINLEDLADAYERENSYEKATALRERAILLRVREFGEFDQLKPPDSGLRRSDLLLSQLAKNYRVLHKHKESLGISCKLLNYQKKLDPESPAVAGILSDMGQVLSEQKNYREAERLLKESIAILLKSDPRHESSALELLAGPKGRSYVSKMNDLRFRVEMASNYIHLAVACQRQGKRTEAEQSYAKVESYTNLCEKNSDFARLRKQAAEGLAALNRI